MLLDILTQREVVIAVAIIGAVIVTLDSRLNRKATPRKPWTRIGYLVTGCSVLLFIIAGFRHD